MRENAPASVVVRFAMVGTPRCGVTGRVQRTESRYPLLCLHSVAPLNAARSSQRDDPTLKLKTVPPHRRRAPRFTFHAPPFNAICSLPSHENLAHYSAHEFSEQDPLARRALRLAKRTARQG